MKKKSEFSNIKKRVQRFPYARTPAQYDLYGILTPIHYRRKVSGEFSPNALKPKRLATEVEIIAFSIRFESNMSSELTHKH